MKKFLFKKYKKVIKWPEEGQGTDAVKHVVMAFSDTVCI